MRGPFRLIEPRNRGVWISTRGLSPSTALRSRTAAAPTAAGLAPGAVTTLVLPPSIFVTGGLAAGKNFAVTTGQPNRISAAITANRMKFLLSLFT